MDEYISKTKFEELMRKKARSNFDLYYVDKAKHYYDKAIGYNTAADEAHDFPTADVQPVKRGRWIWKERHRNSYRVVKGIDKYGKEGDLQIHEEYKVKVNYCSVCGKQGHEAFLNFCPNCGADMRGEENDT